ncbi:MAG: CDP-alcohol phosphatidyltransferase family protein [Gammaproteobacteria bacterium]
MSKKLFLSKQITALIIYTRPIFAFCAMLCAVGVMWRNSSQLYALGVCLLVTTMLFDLVDGWFAARFESQSNLAELADRLLDKSLTAILFPVIAVGIMWRLNNTPAGMSQLALLHAIFVMFICIVALVRDSVANYMRGFAIAQANAPETHNATRLRTMVTTPVGALLYAYAFYSHGDTIPGNMGTLQQILQWLGSFPIKGLFIIEIVFLTLSFGSIAAYCKKYGSACLDELCLGDKHLRRKILAIFPNALTIMNGMMGLLAVFFAYKGRIQEAYLILIGATIFDKLDGALARKLGLTEPLPGSTKHITAGSVMDDLADGLSFCIVPAWIFYITLSEVQNSWLNNIIGPIAILYALLGITRLIVFLLDKNPIPGFFKGMPVPAAATTVTAPLIMLNQSLLDTPADLATSGFDWVLFWSLFSVGLMILSTILMNSYNVRFIHLGRFMSRTPWFGRLTLGALIIMAFTPYIGYAALAYLFCYMVSPFVTWRIDPASAARETR